MALVRMSFWGSSSDYTILDVTAIALGARITFPSNRRFRVYGVGVGVCTLAHFGYRAHFLVYPELMKKIKTHHSDIMLAVVWSSNSRNPGLVQFLFGSCLVLTTGTGLQRPVTQTSAFAMQTSEDTFSVQAWASICGISDEEVAEISPTLSFCRAFHRT